MLGMFDRFTPKFVKKYADFFEAGTRALQQFAQDVEQKVSPGPEHVFTMKDEVYEALLAELER